MNSHTDCIACIINKSNSLCDEYLNNSYEKYEFMQRILKEVVNTEYHKTAPYLMSKITKILKEKIDIDAIYEKEKKYFNNKLLKMEDEIEQEFLNSDNKLFDALKLSSAGNIIDFGALDNINFEMVEDIISKTFNRNFDVNLFKKLKDELSNSNTLVYLGDNAGEIVFDKLFIKEISILYPDLDIYFVTRGKPTLNDITEEDAYFVGIDKYCKVINNGTDIPGTDLEEISNECREIIENAEVIISKGQGNFESLGGCGKNIYYIFLCKCEMLMRKLDESKFANMFISEIKKP